MSEEITKATQTAWLVCRDLEEALAKMRKPLGSSSTTAERMVVQFVGESLQSARELHNRLAMVAGEA